jgi:hypothetical protein
LMLLQIRYRDPEGAAAIVKQPLPTVAALTLGQQH